MKHSKMHGKKYSVRVLIPRMRAQADHDRKINEERQAGIEKAKERQARKQAKQSTDIEIGNVLDEP